MHTRLQHFRAGLLLVLSSALSFWVISYWLPLNDYLAAVGSDKYADYRATIQIFVAVYLIFFVLNLVAAGLAFTKAPRSLKFYLALIPAAVTFITPFLLAIPITSKFPNRNYFEVFQAMYRLFRFTKLDTFIAALAISLLCVGINLLAALMIRRANGELEKVSKKFQSRYLIYSAVTALVLVLSGGINYYNSFVRSVDRESCKDYLALELPMVDEDVTSFLNNIQLYGEQAGTAPLRIALTNFAISSRQYYALLNSDTTDAVLSQMELAVASSKQKVIEICSEFGTD
jgi:hypothetical protein